MKEPLYTQVVRMTIYDEYTTDEVPLVRFKTAGVIKSCPKRPIGTPGYVIVVAPWGILVKVTRKPLIYKE